MKYKSLLISTILVFSGCSLKPDMPKINQDFKASIQNSSISKQWWKSFEDEKLNALIDKALENNSNLKLASLNVLKARETLSLTKKDFLPTLSANAGGARAKTSGETASRAPQAIANDFSVSAILSYEVDLWGRVRDSANASEAMFKSTKYDYDTLRISIASNVATTYFTLITYNEEKDILIDTLEAYKQTMDYQKKQLNAGAISELTYLQSVGEYESARVRLSNVQHSIDLTQGALALLVGNGLDEILYKDYEASKVLPKIPDVPSGISSDVLLNRADVASAYEKIKSSNYLVGVAKTAYFPTLSLTGTFGYQSDSLGDLFKSNANMWTLGGSLAGKILDFGRTSKNVDIAKINQDMSVVNYNLVIKTALSEVRNALRGRKNALKTQEYQTAFLKSQNKIYKLSKDMFDEGYTTHLELLDAQRYLLSAKIQNAESKLNAINSIVEVYKAFGGGFVAEKEE